MKSKSSVSVGVHNNVNNPPLCDLWKQASYMFPSDRGELVGSYTAFKRSEREVGRREDGQKFPGYPAGPEISQGSRRWCLKWTFIRGYPSSHNPNVEEETEDSKRGDNTRNRCVDDPHVP